MGVLCDYFRAPDAATAVRVMDVLGGPLAVDDAGQPACDGVDAKGVDPAVAFGQLVALIRGVPWTPDTIGSELLWPAAAPIPTRVEEMGALPSESPWVTGPWLVELDERTRDTLAGLEDDRHPQIAAQWARIEEFEPYCSNDAGHLLTLVTELTALARRARTADDRLYCWTCL